MDIFKWKSFGNISKDQNVHFLAIVVAWKGPELLVWRQFLLRFIL